jgi:polyisoprenyl-teichoic acid--peptidoglycan teichoic acid transferase
MWKKIGLIVLILLLVFGFTAAYFTYSSLNKIKKVDLPVSDEEIGITPEIIEENFEADVLNIAFFGLDARNPDLASRSDSIMVVSIDRKNQKVKVTSLMRDMYVQIPGREDNRINTAYVFGGPALALKTINSDFSLDIKNFVTVNFYGLEDLINKVGGVLIDIKPEEVSEAQVKKSGLQKLSGEQAVAYARIRHVGNNDFERTERQRRIVNELFKTIKSQGILKLPGTINTLLPYVETNLSDAEILKFASEVIKFNTDNIEGYRLPADGTYKSQKIRGMAVLVPNINKNKQMLHDFIYGKDTKTETEIDIKTDNEK